MNQKKLTYTFIALYLLPWGMQCLVDNFIPVFVNSLSFTTEKTVGQVTAIGAIVTMITQLLWTSSADKAKNKGTVLAFSLVLLAISSTLFVFVKQNMTTLFAITILFYSCYLVHQPLIDSIVGESYEKTGKSFGFLRSFASLGYALTGLLFGFVNHQSSKSFFYYVIALSLLSIIAAKLVPDSTVKKMTKEKSEKGFKNKNFILFLVFTLFLFIQTSMVTTFFPVYYSEINNNIGLLSIAIGAGTFMEWGLMSFLGKKLEQTSPKTVFLLVVVATLLRSLSIYLIQNEYWILISVFLNGIVFGILWSVATPYLTKILPANQLTGAQGVWTVVAFGIAKFIGSYLGGILAETFGLRNLFGIISVTLTVFALVTPLLFPRKKTL
ncbi:MAG: MFS transporter [Ruminococcaceae bacterium]|nr:MFS transporter [Oscillospiraceae bacterium]